jgi:exopolyphosphatase / guanosine-5'-triphosphate,3'-diphosphate pyrophosphatase
MDQAPTKADSTSSGKGAQGQSPASAPPASRTGFLEFGSTSIKFYLVDLAGEKAGEIVEEIKIPWDVGYDVFQHRRIAPGTMSRCLSALQDLKRRFPDIAFEGVTGVGTSALREAQNAEVFQRLLDETLRVKLHIIEGGIEAFLLETGFKERVREFPTALFDLGGGSLELVEYLSPSSTKKTHVPVGAIRLHCLLQRKRDIFEYVREGRRIVMETIEAHLVGGPPHLRELVGTGGTVRAVVQSLKKDRFAIEDVQALIQEEIHGRPTRSLPPHRRRVFLPGLVAIECLFPSLGVREITYQSASVKKGLLSLARMIPVAGRA